MESEQASKERELGEGAWDFEEEERGKRGAGIYRVCPGCVKLTPSISLLPRRLSLWLS